MSITGIPIMLSIDEVMDQSDMQRWAALRRTIDQRTPSGNRPPQAALAFWEKTGEHNVLDHWIDDDRQLRRSLIWLEVRSRRGVFVLELVVLDYEYIGWLHLVDKVEKMFKEEGIPVEVDIVEGKVVDKHIFEKVKRPAILVEGINRQYGEGALIARLGFSSEAMDALDTRVAHDEKVDHDEKVERLKKRREKIEEGRKKVAEWAASWPRHDEMASGHRDSSASNFF